MNFSVVILNYNTRYFLELCLQSVQEAIKSLDAEIIVVDNHSSDNSCEVIKNQFPEVVLIENPNNDGFAKGNNIGVARAKGEYVCVLNPDTVVAEDTFVKILEFANSKDNLGIIGCKLIDGTGKFLPESKRNVPMPLVSLKKILGNSKYYYANHLNTNDIGRADVQVGAFMFLKRSLYNRLNGFDEDFFMYGEDIDLSYRSLKEGYNNYYFGKTTAIHYKGESTLKDELYLNRFYGAMQIFYKKHFKTNKLFDLIIIFGIKLARLFTSKPKGLSVKTKYHVLVSNNDNQALLSLFPSLKRVNKMEEVESETEIIFDANALSYKEMINVLENFSTKKDITFKILPKNANFIIGSNYSYLRGEVVKFNN